MAAKLTDFTNTKLTDVASWNSLNLFAWPSINKSNSQYEEDFGVEMEMDEDISLHAAYDFNRV